MSRNVSLLFCLLFLPLIQLKNEENEVKEVTKVVLETGGDHNISTNLIVETKNETKNDKWIYEAIVDIAYYLRSHKFNEFDRRYDKLSPNVSRTYFQKYPSPPLRALHWEVHKNCEQELFQCVLYVWKKIKKTSMQRKADTSVLIETYNWTIEKNDMEISSLEAECQKGRELDFNLAEPFEGPLERFQWRTTVTYYFCWFTMLQLPQLKHFHTRCDNFAACLDPEFGSRNHDPRANDSKPFQCALYSFCPDPCCPIKHISSLETCWNHNLNPCKRENPAQHRQCQLHVEANQDFHNLLLNHWNISCECPLTGFEWSSAYGICVDIDECAKNLDTCDREREACVNLPGKYFCACKNAFEWNDNQKVCERNEIWEKLKVEETQKNVLMKKKNMKNTKATSIFGLIKKWFT